MNRRYKSNLLFPRTNFLVGMGSVFNISGNYFRFNYSKSSEEADLKALESDWGVIGEDIKEVFHSLSGEESLQKLEEVNE